MGYEMRRWRGKGWGWRWLVWCERTAGCVERGEEKERKEWRRFGAVVVEFAFVVAVG